MYTHISVELLTNQKVKEAHRAADQYRLLAQGTEIKHRSIRSNPGLISWIFIKLGRNKIEREVDANASI